MTLIKLLKNGFTSFLIRAIAPCLTHGGSLENISTAPPRFVTHTTTPMASTSRLKKGEVEESVNVICKSNGRTVSGGKIRKRMLYSYHEIYVGLNHYTTCTEQKKLRTS